METRDAKAATAAEDNPSALAAYARLLVPIGITLGLAVTVQIAFALDRAGTKGFWAWAAGPSVVVAAFALWRAHRDGELASWMKPVWGDPTRGIASAALLVGAAIAFVHVAAPVGSDRESWMARLYLQFGDPTRLRDHAVEVALAVVVAATAEEIVWRGLVTRLVAEVVGSRTAWIWAACLYALAQVPTFWQLEDPVAGHNPLVVFAALALGLVWGLMGRVFGRLTPGILSHVAFDWCVIMMFRLWGPAG
jgi:membrane protease YdiL (CAAX protease family)